MFDMLYRRAVAQGAPEAFHQPLRQMAVESGFAPPSASRVPDPACCVPVRHRVELAARHPLLRDRVLGLVLLAPCTRFPAAQDPDVLGIAPHARHFGFGVVEVRWLFGVPVTCGAQLGSFADPVRPGTDAALDELARCAVVVAAWGDGGGLLDALLWDRVWTVGNRLEHLSGRGLQCLAVERGFPSPPSEISGRVSRLQPFKLERIPASVRPDTPQLFGSIDNLLPSPA